MKKSIFTLILAALMGVMTSGLPITRVDKIAPTDMVFMDMATEAAKASHDAGNRPDGAVIILNNAFRSSGRPSANASAVENAFNKSRLSSLKNATVYVVNEPVTADYVMLSRMGAEAVYFVNGRAEVVAAGIYPADAYDDAAIPADVTPAPLSQMEYPDAAALVK